MIIEAKGFFKPSDRRKMLAVKEAHPHLDIRFVFMRDNTLSKNSKTTYTSGLRSMASRPASSRTFHPTG